jgi:HD-like signal output (HDOD) protein
MPKVSEFFESVQLPTIPDVAHELISTMRDDDIPFEKVRSAIVKDPALTAKLIRLANSARFGLPRQVASLDDAIIMVGLNQVRTLALAACMSGVFKDAPGLDAQAFWKESMAIGGYAQWLARTLGADAQQSWLAGFLVRLGELIIAQKAPEQIEAIEHLPHHAGGRWERERSLLGFSEAQVTAELARRWNFPESLVRALETAEDPLAHTPFCRQGGIVHVAMLLAEIGLEEPMPAADAISSLPTELKQALQLDSGWLVEHLPPVESFVDVPVK